MITKGIRHTAVFTVPLLRAPNYEPLDPKTSMSVGILRKLRYFPVASIIWGKDIIDGQLVENTSRQYEFRLHIELGLADWGLCFLYMKGKANHFKNKCLEGLPLIHGGAYQAIPLTYSVLSQMKKEELYTIWGDLD